MIRTFLMVLMLVSALAAQKNLLVNGSFEQGTAIPPTQSSLTVTTWSTAITGWNVGGSVMVLDASWSPTDGVRSIGLNAVGSKIYQRVTLPHTFPTLATYQLRFDLGGTGSSFKELFVSAGGVNRTFTVPNGKPPSVAYDRDIVITFTTRRTWADVLFASRISDSNGPHIDNVRLYVGNPPVTATYTPFGTGCRNAVLSSGATRPVIGQNLVLTTTGLGGGIFGMLLTGSSNTQWGPYALPFNLAPKTCNILVSGEIITPFLIVGGVGSTTIPIPNDANLLGSSFYNQAISIGWGAMLSRLSNGGKAYIGNQ